MPLSRNSSVKSFGRISSVARPNDVFNPFDVFGHSRINAWLFLETAFGCPERQKTELRISVRIRFAVNRLKWTADETLHTTILLSIAINANR